MSDLAHWAVIGHLAGGVNAEGNMAVRDAAAELHGEGALRTSAPSSFQLTDSVCPCHASKTLAGDQGYRDKSDLGTSFAFVKYLRGSQVR